MTLDNYPELIPSEIFNKTDWKQKILESYRKKEFHVEILDAVLGIIDSHASELNIGDNGELFQSRVLEDAGSAPLRDKVTQQLKSIFLESDFYEEVKNEIKKDLRKRNFRLISHGAEIFDITERIKSVLMDRPRQRYRDPVKDPPRRKRKIEVVPVEEQCGYINTRGKACPKRRGFCPWHESLRQLQGKEQLQPSASGSGGSGRSRSSKKQQQYKAQLNVAEDLQTGMKASSLSGDPSTTTGVLDFDSVFIRELADTVATMQQENNQHEDLM